MGFLRTQFEKAKKGVKAEFKHRAAIRKAERKSYREAQKVEAHNYGIERAKHEREQKVKRLKQKPKSFDFKGFAGPTQRGAGPSISDALLGSQPKKKRREGFDDMRLF